MQHFPPYLLSQIEKYPSIAKQYLPDPREKNNTGLRKPFQGIINTGIPGLERMYLDRVAFMFTNKCFAYCRFCFRKNYDPKKDFCSSKTDQERALKYINNDPRIKEVLITGGDPLLFPKQVISLCKKLRKIPHLTGIRIGTRIFTSAPELINAKWIKLFSTLNHIKINPNRPSAAADPNNPNRLNSPISISPHINHPDELSPQTIQALLLCTQNNIPLYNQTVLLKDINDDPEILIDLCRKLRQLGVEPYRVYHADPVAGTKHFRTSLEIFLEIKRYMRAQASGRIVPSFIIDTRIGKVELGDSEIFPNSPSAKGGSTSGGNNPTVHIKTPYTLNIFQSIDPSWKLPEYCRLAEDGRIIVEYQDA